MRNENYYGQAPPPMCLPSVYLTSPRATRSPGLLPPYLHTYCKWSNTGGGNGRGYGNYLVAWGLVSTRWLCMLSPVWLKTEWTISQRANLTRGGGGGWAGVREVWVLLWSPRVCINQREHNLDQALIIRADYISYIMKYTLLTHC